MKTDITFTDDGLNVMFLPNTDAGRVAWGAMLAECDNDSCKFPSHFLPNIKAQLKAAGYTVRKERTNTQSIDDILAELEA